MLLPIAEMLICCALELDDADIGCNGVPLRGIPVAELVLRQ